MRAVWDESNGPADVLQSGESPDPAPAAGRYHAIARGREAHASGRPALHPGADCGGPSGGRRRGRRQRHPGTGLVTRSIPRLKVAEVWGERHRGETRPKLRGRLSAQPAMISLYPRSYSSRSRRYRYRASQAPDDRSSANRAEPLPRSSGESRARHDIAPCTDGSR